MAQKVQILRIDDLDGSEAEENILFGLDGTGYEIDLSGSNAAKLRKTLAAYVSNARIVTARGAGGARPGRRARADRSDTHRSNAIRDWARGKGVEVRDRGRLPAGIVADWEAAGKPGL